ncbi:MAG TPA: hypothetical protein VFK02_05900 [Kofleriaceae bacterium]|nr:hypothetical protein [Kofleriaceae bacterium]
MSGALRSDALAAPSPAPRHIAYVGVHPIPAPEGGGFCDIEGPHVHLYLPVHPDELYRVVGGRYLFIGDPVPFGYDGPTHVYAGRHPIPVDLIVHADPPEPHASHDPVFCYLDGPHYHIYAPPPGPSFVLRGDAYWYVGEWPRSYQADGPRYQKINVVYNELTYTRPVITVTAPAGYHVPVIEVTVARPKPVRTSVELRPRPSLVIDDDDDDDDDGVYYYYYYRRPRHHHGHHHHHRDPGPYVIEIGR